MHFLIVFLLLTQQPIELKKNDLAPFDGFLINQFDLASLYLMVKKNEVCLLEKEKQKEELEKKIKFEIDKQFIIEKKVKDLEALTVLDKKELNRIKKECLNCSKSGFFNKSFWTGIVIGVVTTSISLFTVHYYNK